MLKSISSSHMQGAASARGRSRASPVTCRAPPPHKDADEHLSSHAHHCRYTEMLTSISSHVQSDIQRWLCTEMLTRTSIQTESAASAQRCSRASPFHAERRLCTDNADEHLYSRAERCLCTENADEHLYSYAEHCLGTEMMTSASIYMRSAAAAQKC